MAVNVAAALGRCDLDHKPPGHLDSGEEKGAMAIEFDGRTIATTATGHLENWKDWTEALGATWPSLKGSSSQTGTRTL